MKTAAKHWLDRIDPQMLRRALASAFACWIVHALLRLAQLIRPAPYGSPFVEKFEWYFFHAVAYDILWSLPFWLPCLLIYAALPAGRGRLYKLPLWITLGVQAVYMTFSALDHEMMRFLAVHGSLSQFKTYIGAETVSELPALISGDAGGVGLPLVLILGCGGLTVFLAIRIGRRLTRRQTSLRRLLAYTAVGLGLSYGLLFHFWKGGFRLLKLRPLPESIYRELVEGDEDRLSPEDLAEASAVAQDLWRRHSATPWIFPDPEAPFYREPLHVACGRDPAPEGCDADADGDGYAARVDCDDHAPAVHPGGEDQPGNGLDEDCDGADAEPWNVVLILLESHRGVNTGHLQAEGAPASDTPTLDRLAARPDARIFTRHQVNGVPTIEAFFNAHCSIYSKNHGHAATDNTTTAARCLPQHMRDHGYYTRFFTAAAPDWDNQTFWLAQWYDDYVFDRGRQTDLSMLRHMARWMADNLTEKQPFFVGAITKTNHFPFNPVDDMTEAERAGTPRKIGVTMRYTERALGELFDQIEGAPWFDHTVFIITADHGFNWGEKGFYRLGDPLHRPSTWLPLLMIGAHPKLMALPKRVRRLSSHVDLAPTVLDLIGARDPNSFAGHSLLDPTFRADPYVFASHGLELVWEQGHHRSLLPPPGLTRPQGEEIFNNVEDFLMDHPLEGPEIAPLLDEARRYTLALRRLTDHVFFTDTLIPQAGRAPAAP